MSNSRKYLLLAILCGILTFGGLAVVSHTRGAASTAFFCIPLFGLVLFILAYRKAKQDEKPDDGGEK